MASNRIGRINEEIQRELSTLCLLYTSEYIAAALSPADVVSVDVHEEGKSCRVVVPDDQLSLAIGKEGQNARLAAKLTGWKIDIKPESAPADEDVEDDVILEDEVETEEMCIRDSLYHDACRERHFVRQVDRQQRHHYLPQQRRQRGGAHFRRVRHGCEGAGLSRPEGTLLPGLVYPGGPVRRAVRL